MYHPLEQEQYQRADYVITQLAKYLEENPDTRMNVKSQNFVRDSLSRLQRYEENIQLSPAQIKWLEDLFTKFIEERDSDEDETSEGLEPVDKKFRRWSNY